MSAPSVPIVLDKEYRLRFDDTDLVVIEEKLGCGIIRLFQPDKVGLSVARVLVWRGLHTEKDNGDLVHTFPQTTAGLTEAQKFVMDYVQTEQVSLGSVFDKLAYGLAASLGMKIVGADKGSPTSEEVTGKNP